MNLVDFREFAESVPPHVEEPAGIMELPVTGWVLHPRINTVRIVCYIARGEPPHVRREPTLILHVPIRGFMRSMAHTILTWRTASEIAH